MCVADLIKLWGEIGRWWGSVIKLELGPSLILLLSHGFEVGSGMWIEFRCSVGVVPFVALHMNLGYVLDVAEGVLLVQ